MDENVIPVVEELQRRLPPVGSIHQNERGGKEYSAAQHDMEVAEEDGMLNY